MRQVKLISNFQARTYQQSIFGNSINKNSLVVIPTGMGKTVIAIMLASYYFNKTNKKILFLAPTKPLVEQQEKSFKDFYINSDDFNFQVLTGLVAPKKREVMYKENDFIFSTPQLIENDIVNRIVDPKDFCLVIFDEAHRATGNYAYCFIAEQFANSSKILALTASPGTDKDVITEVIDNLRIEHLEVKKSTDRDVKPYVKQVEVDKIQVELTPELEQIKLLFDTCFSKRLDMLKELGFLDDKKSAQITKTNLLELQSYLRTQITQGDADDNIWQAVSIAAGLMKLQYGQELFESQELSAAYTYFYNFFRPGGDKSKAAEALTQDVDFREGFEALSKLNKAGVEHPKLIKLKEIVNKEILSNKDLKIIVFNQYRDSAEKIVKELEKIKEIKPALFVGQAKKGEIKLSQKEQKKILEDFREHKYNIIVSTSVGEEGLDIPKVDLVIFYEPIPSAIRSIQRIGRTGRFRKGRAKILITKGTRDVVTSFVSSAKERKMYRVLDELKNKFDGLEGQKSQKGLTKFFEARSVATKEIIGIDKRVDNRSNRNNYKQYNTIIFDLNRVLVDYINDDKSEAEHQRILGMSISDFWEVSVQKYFTDCVIGKYDLDVFIKKSLKDLNLDDNLYEDVLKLYTDAIIRMDGIKEILDLLYKRYNLILLAGDGKNCLDIKLDKIGLRKYFSSIYCTCFEGLLKDDKRIYQRVIEKEKLDVDKCLFVDDMKKYLKVAKDVGIEGLRFENSKKLKNDLIKFGIIEDISSSLDNNSKYQIYIDNRENNDLLKELFNIEDLRVEAKKLEVADIVITDKIAIERKAKIDFVNSIIDKRLFPQLIDLAKNYQRPILILEGEENIFSLRNLNPNVIRATLSAIAVDLRIPIIYTNNLADTANMILTITKRAQKDKKDISLVAQKSSISENQELEKFVSSIPKINVSNAKKLLNYFKSIKNLVSAKEDKLQKVEGIGKGRAKNLKDFFTREYE